MITSDIKVNFRDDLLSFVDMRALQVSIASAYKRQRMRCPVHLSIGQEYWLPTFGRLLPKQRRIFSTHRSHSMYMAVGASPYELIAELHGLTTGCLQGLGGSMHLKSLENGLECSVPIVGSSLPLSIGSAFASKHLNSPILTVSYFGDAACEEGAFHESLNIASTYQLPILFVCENNSFSCNTPIPVRQPSPIMSRFSDSHCIKSYSFNHQDSLPTIQQILTSAFAEAMTQPVFLEIFSNRLYEHCGHLPDMTSGDRNELLYEQLVSQDLLSHISAHHSDLFTIYQSKLLYYSNLILQVEEM